MNKDTLQFGFFKVLRMNSDQRLYSALVQDQFSILYSKDKYTRCTNIGKLFIFDNIAAVKSFCIVNLPSGKTFEIFSVYADKVQRAKLCLPLPYLNRIDQNAERYKNFWQRAISDQNAHLWEDDKYRPHFVIPGTHYCDALLLHQKIAAFNFNSTDFNHRSAIIEVAVHEKKGFTQ